MTALTTARFLNKMPHGFSNVVDVPAGRLIFVTGQMSVGGNDYQLLHPGDFKAQVEVAFANVASQLEAAGATFHDVVKIETLAVEEEFMAGMYAFGEVRDRFVNVENPPASAVTLVAKLVHPGALIDVAVIAQLPS